MEEKIYTITLADGTVISNLRLNGNNFISEEEIDPSVFEDNTYKVSISDGETTNHYKDMILERLNQYEGNWWFILRELSTSELDRIRIQSQIEYLAMMTDVEL